MWVVLSPSGSAFVDGEDVGELVVTWRGPLYSIAWRRDGRPVRVLVFPDAIDIPGRRELRLHALRRREDAPAAAVAP